MPAGDHGLHDTPSDYYPGTCHKKKTKNREKDTDELIKLRRQLVQPNCPNKLGPFIVTVWMSFAGWYGYICINESLHILST